MKVLVTGHLGYVGSVLVPLLVEHGHQVLGVDSNLYKRCTYAGSLWEVPQNIQDIRDLQREDVRGFDAVLHLAGLSNDPLGDLDPELTRQINHLATVRLARLCRDEGVRRFLFASTCSIYGASNGDLIDESAPARPVTPYGCSKIDAERELAELATPSFWPVFLRAGTVHGFSPRLRFDLVVNNLTAWAVADRRVLIKSDGMAWRPLVHVHDLAHAYLALLEAPDDRIRAQAFNIGSTDQNHRVREVAEIVRDAVTGCRIAYGDQPVADSRCYRVDCSRFSSLFPDHVPRRSVREGVEELVRVFHDQGLTVEDFEGPRFQRIAHVRWLLARGLVGNDLRVRDRVAV